MSQITDLCRAVSRKRANFSQAVRRSRDEDGVGAATRLAVRWVGEGTMRPISDLRQRLLDRRLGVETRRADGPDAEAMAVARYVDGNPYAPTPARQFTRMLASLPIDEPSEFTFVDLGCGKGLTLMLAAEHGFPTVVGVELDRRLAEVAGSNVRSFVARSPDLAGVIEVVTGDAAGFPLPAGPVVVFLFNSFGEATLSAVVETVERSLTRSPRPLFVAYYNPVHRDVLDRSAMLRRLAHTTRWALYEAVRSH